MCFQGLKSFAKKSPQKSLKTYLFVFVLQVKDNFAGKISTSGDVIACLAMSYFTPISEFKVRNSLPENKYLTC